MLSFRLLVIIVPCLFGTCHSLSSGAPKGACKTMTPSHGVAPQATHSPFSVIATTDGNTVQVKIQDKMKQTPFRGFLLQAILPNGSIIEDGEFTTTDKTRKLECSTGKLNALTHNSNEEKASISTTWTPPAGFQGTVVFRATVVEKKVEFWVDFRSDPVSVTATTTATSDPTESRLTASPGQLTVTAETSSVTVTVSNDVYSGCGSLKGCFGLPSNCVPKKACEMVLTFRPQANESVIKFELVGSLSRKEDSGWFAMALSKDSKMGDDSVTECVLQRDQVEMYESWNFRTEKELYNERISGPRNITVDETEAENGVVSCRWSRPISTVVRGIVFDVSERDFYILLAKGPLKNNGDKNIHTTKLPSANPVNLFSTSLILGRPSTFIKIHGSFMTAAWIGFVSIAILLARHYKEVWSEYKLCGTKVWFTVHRSFMLLSVALVIVGFVIIFIYVDGWSLVGRNPHPILGCIATGLILIQPIIAICRPAPTSPNRPIFRWIHGMIGNGAQLIACVNMFFAVSLKESNIPQAFYWVLVTFVVFHCLIHLLIHIHTCFMERERERESNAKPGQFQSGDGEKSDHEAPGSAFKKFVLGLYSMVNAGLTTALILMICLN